MVLSSHPTLDFILDMTYSEDFQIWIPLKQIASPGFSHFEISVSSFGISSSELQTGVRGFKRTPLIYQLLYQFLAGDSIQLIDHRSAVSYGLLGRIFRGVAFLHKTSCWKRKSYWKLLCPNFEPGSWLCQTMVHWAIWVNGIIFHQ